MKTALEYLEYRKLIIGNDTYILEYKMQRKNILNFDVTF